MDVRDKLGATPLMNAAECGHVRVFRRLLDIWNVLNKTKLRDCVCVARVDSGESVVWMHCERDTKHELPRMQHMHAPGTAHQDEAYARQVAHQDDAIAKHHAHN